MGTQIGWQPDWGWGELNLTQASAERSNWQASVVAGGKAKLYEMSSQAITDRATLVWQRRVESCFVLACQTNTTHTLTNLDLYAYDLDTQTLEASSASSIDNVEQVRAQDTGATPDLLKVKASSTVEGVPAEPFAIDGTRVLTPVKAPEPNAAIQSITPSRVRPGELVTITASVANPSTDLAAPSFTTTASGAGVEIVSAPSSPPTQLAKKNAAGDTTTLTWTVRAPSDGTYNFTIQGQAQSYQETWKGTAATASFTVDGTPPSPTISAPAGSVCAPALPVAWGATDGSGVSSYDVDVQIDGGLFSGWLPAATATSGSYLGALGHSYGFRVRATDGLGNLSAPVSSGTASVVDCTQASPGAGDGSGGDGDAPTKARPKILIAKTVVKRGRLLVYGRIAKAATGRVTATLKRGKRVLARTRAKVTHGSFRLRLPARTRRGTLTLRYPGDKRHLPQTLSRAIRAR